MQKTVQIQIDYEYLELINQDSILFNLANNLKIYLCFKLHANYLENAPHQIIESAENQMLIFSQLNYSTPESTSPNSSEEASSSNNNVVNKCFTYQPLLAL